jgi:hypothetical protein
MTGSRKPIASVALLLGSLLVMAGRAEAFDLNGAWASDADQCAKVFVRQGEGSVSPKCPTSRKDVGVNVNLIAACATDIMLSSVQLSVKELDADSIARLFPGMEDMEVRYHRCPSQ